MQGPLALSKDTCRFQIPMDVRDLEKMSVLNYLTGHCLICSRRYALFKNVFTKVDKDKDGLISLKELRDALSELYMTSDAKICAAELIELLKIDEWRFSDTSKSVTIQGDKSEESNCKAEIEKIQIQIDFGAFKGSAAIVERMMYAKKYGASTEGDGQMKKVGQNHRLPLEQTDFSGLSWKIRGIKVNKNILVLFKYL